MAERSERRIVRVRRLDQDDDKGPCMVGQPSDANAALVGAPGDYQSDLMCEPCTHRFQASRRVRRRSGPRMSCRWIGPMSWSARPRLSALSAKKSAQSVTHITGWAREPQLPSRYAISGGTPGK